jgi:uncharacterized membrane protein YhhN
MVATRLTVPLAPPAASHAGRGEIFASTLARMSTAAVSPPVARRPVWPRYALPAFLAVGALNLLFEAAGPRLAFDLTKPLLMPLLLAALLATGRAVPRLLLGALAGSFVGDTMLLFSGTWFLVGMAGFAVTHVCYIRQFVRSGATRRRRGRAAFAAACYAALWVVLITRLWPDLAANMRIPVACYSLLLAGMATTAFATGARTAVGGALFLASDTLIAGGIAHWHMPAGTGFTVMATYLVAQLLLATGCMRLRPQPHPRQRQRGRGPGR